MSKVGTKKVVGAEAMRSRNLSQSVSNMKHSLASVLHIRMVSRNTVMKRNFISFAAEKSWSGPTELVHFFRK